MPGGWERLVRHEGGTVVALAAAPLGNGATAFFAATATGLFRSDNLGQHWMATASESPVPLLTAVAPSARFAENRLLFVGSRTGFFRSTDAGRTARQTLSGGIFTIALVPASRPASGPTSGPESGAEDRVFVGTERDGILRSDDGGRTWAGANPGLLDLTILALAFSPDVARDQTGFAATASGLYRSRNGGKSWREVALPLDEPAVQCLAFSPAYARDRLILAGTESEGLWRSADGGAGWNRLSGLPTGGIGAIAFLPGGSSGNRIAVATDGGIALSYNGGETWELTGQHLPPVFALAALAALANGVASDGELLIAGQYRDGIARFRTGEPRNGWVPSSAGLEATHLTTLVASPMFARDPTLFVAGPETGLRASRDGGRTWSEAVGNISAAAIHDMVASPDSTSKMIAAVTDAGIYRSGDGGETWQLSAGGGGGDVPAEIIAIGMSAERTPPFIVAATRDGRLIASDNGGERWRSLPIPFGGETIFSLACSPDAAQNRTLYAVTAEKTAGQAGKDEGTVCLWHSNNGGEHWACWLKESGDGMQPLAIAPDGSLFVGIGGQVFRPRRHAWQTCDGVRSPVWNSTALVGADGAPAAITALAVSPHYGTDGVVVAATGAGIYRSRDRGETFERWSEDLTPVPILALLATITTTDDMRDEPGVSIFALNINGTIWQRTTHDAQRVTHSDNDAR